MWNRFMVLSVVVMTLAFGGPALAGPPTGGCRGNCESGGDSSVTNTNVLSNTLNNTVNSTSNSAAAASSSSSVNFHPTLTNTQGQSQGQHQGQGQSQSNTQTGTFTGNSSGNSTTTTFAPSTRIEGPAIAPDLSSLAPSAPCKGGVTASGGGVGVSIGFGYTWTDDQCEQRENAKVAMQEAQEIASMGYRHAAVAILCNIPQMQAALGDDCGPQFGSVKPTGAPVVLNAPAPGAPPEGYVLVGRDPDGTPHYVPSAWAR